MRRSRGRGADSRKASAHQPKPGKHQQRRVLPLPGQPGGIKGMENEVPRPFHAFPLPSSDHACHVTALGWRGKSWQCKVDCAPGPPRRRRLQAVLPRPEDSTAPRVHRRMPGL